MNWLYIALFINVMLLVVLALIVWRLYSELARLRSSASELLSAHDLPAELGEQGPRTLITLEILNPLTVVAQRSWVGGKVSTLSPGLMRRIVLNQTRDQLKAGLEENGIEVDARIVRVG
ncbi:hypothetical protein [Litorivivens sp.]|uniref:hypothetical protein n=1 Tax=Litorivivens sp. TaxID=2020868 RepID=UPI00356AFB60